MLVKNFSYIDFFNIYFLAKEKNFFNEIILEMERETGLEPATSTLARLRSTN